MTKVMICLVGCLAIVALLGSCNSSADKKDNTVVDKQEKEQVDPKGAKTNLNPQKTDVSVASFPNSEEGAMKIAKALNKQDDYAHKLYKSLFPDEPDFSYIVTTEEDRVLLNEYTYPTYRRGLYMYGKEGETEVLLHTLTAKDIKNGNFGAFDESYGAFAKVLRDDITFYAFEFVEAGAETGTRFETLVCINDKWIFTPTPYKAFKQ